MDVEENTEKLKKWAHYDQHLGYLGFHEETGVCITPGGIDKLSALHHRVTLTALWLLAPQKDA
jgi:hypothetical protein